MESKQPSISETLHEREEEVSSPNEKAFWRLLLIATAIYCFLAFCVGCSASVLVSDYVFFFGTVLMLAFAQLTSAMAALGPGRYWSRLLITQACWFAVVYSLRMGVSWAMLSTSDRNLMTYCGCALTASLACQVSFGIMRVSAGWRLRLTDMSRESTFSLGDMFVLMLFVAITLATCQRALGNAILQEIQGNVKLIFLYCLWFSSLISFVIGVPILGIVFLARESSNGRVVLLFFALIVAVLGLAQFGITGRYNLIAPFLISVLCFFFLSAVPLAVMRANGYLLTTWHEQEPVRRIAKTTTD